MFSGSMEKINNVPVQKNIETRLNSKEAIEGLEKWLESFMEKEEAAQFVSVLHSMAEMDFQNHCNQATQELARRLKTKFGGLANAEFYDVRNEKPLPKIGYRGDFHSVALIEFKSEGKEDFSLVIDLTYGNVSRRSQNDAIKMFKCEGSKEKALKMLADADNYGGSWQAEYKFNKENGNFVFID